MARAASTYRSARRNKVRQDHQLRYWRLSTIGQMGKRIDHQEPIRFLDPGSIVAVRNGRVVRLP